MEVKDLNIIPSGEMPVIHASQFDVNRTFKFNLKEDGEDYELDNGITIACAIKKVDGNLVTFEVTNTEDKYIELTLPEQATACAGINVGKVIFTDEDNYEIGSINFILDIERSPKQGGIESASSIHDLTEQIEEITTEIIGNDYYNKTQVDELLEGKADVSDIPDMSDYYNKTQTDALLDQKANVSQLPDMSLYYSKTQTDSLLSNKADKSNTYTKSEVDSALALKANLTDLPDMSNYYTKTQVDQKILDIMPVNTASGSIANFTTSLALPLVALKAYITAQGGGGTPSAPVAIVGKDSIKIYQRGVNLWDEEWEVGEYNIANGNKIDSASVRCKEKIAIKGGATYRIYSLSGTTNDNVGYCFYDEDENYISGHVIKNRATLTAPDNARYLTFFMPNSWYGSTYNNDISINYPSTDTQYHAYNPNSTEYTIQLGQTCYGGYIDKESRKLVITHKKVDMGDLSWTYSSSAFKALIADGKIGTTVAGQRTSLCDIYNLANAGGTMQNLEYIVGSTYWSTSCMVVVKDSDYSDATIFKNAVTGHNLVYELATPIETDITIPDITALVGENNIFADSGDIEVSFKQDIANYVDSKISDANANRSLALMRATVEENSDEGSER